MIFLGTYNWAGAVTFTGLPVTYAALIFPVVVWGALKANLPLYYWSIRTVVVGTALLFVCRLKVPKPRGRAYGFFVVLAMGMAVCWLAIGP